MPDAEWHGVARFAVRHSGLVIPWSFALRH
jgi:hypothetical protein